ncbi:MAG: hypothetical protein AUH29_07210 [Candidatus Rokubacteria bacterium 13_1_40CM_69_27]|nr:MAG: hypothetical protein AUH29_07210 [Candidatus Rokubacteria bacterium 13_1_40CM_69_27]OLC39813.1 MAG: hypothetical protein AUH81_00230 [Candidatus Rokubacteria bacterium 13_1_40CM_4_69_5]
MTRVHDRGGWPGAGPIDRQEHQLADWELLADALVQSLASPHRGIIRIDELRRAIESLPSPDYESLSYYERWIAAVERLMIEKKIVTREEIDAKVATLGEECRE